VSVHPLENSFEITWSKAQGIDVMGYLVFLGETEDNLSLYGKIGIIPWPSLAGTYNIFLLLLPAMTETIIRVILLILSNLDFLPIRMRMKIPYMREKLYSPGILQSFVPIETMIVTDTAIFRSI
jgi:hypothetical protein